MKVNVNSMLVCLLAMGILHCTAEPITLYVDAGMMFCCQRAEQIFLGSFRAEVTARYSSAGEWGERLGNFVIRNELAKPVELALPVQEVCHAANFRSPDPSRTSKHFFDITIAI